MNCRLSAAGCAVTRPVLSKQLSALLRPQTGGSQAGGGQHCLPKAWHRPGVGGPQPSPTSKGLRGPLADSLGLAQRRDLH